MYKLYCRTFQFFFKIGARFLPWREPTLLKGENALLRLPETIKQEGITKVIIVTDKDISSLGLMNSLLSALQEAHLNYVIFDDTVPNPTIQNVEDALILYKEQKCEAIIAFGGGSPMDCAKTLAARVAKPRKPVPKMKGLFRILKKTPLVFAVPTTAGTGSEATIAAVISNPDTKEKYAISDCSLIPHYAVLDPLLTLKLPKHITATTGMDTLTHAVEAYIGRSNTAYTKECAIKTVKLVFENILQVYSHGDDICARENMQMAAYYGGVAFTRAYVGYVHAVAHTLGGFYKLPHGLANAIILPHVLETFGESVYAPLAELADVVGITEKNNSKQEKAEKFIAAIKKFNKEMDIPEFIDIIEQKDIPLMVRRALSEANPLYPVPKIFNEDEMKAVYLKISGSTKELFYGYHGKFAEIDLSSGEVSDYPLSEELISLYVGGKTLAAKIIYDCLFAEERENKVEALSEENIVVVSTGPITGTGSPCSSRFNISSISPLTGILVSSNCGGSFGIHLKKAGYDGLIIKGKSKDNIYINIENDVISLNNADHLWGRNTFEVQEELGTKNCGTLAIGPAGENLVRYANIISGERAAGRGGLGAVLGFKKLKAIVAKGNKNFVIYDKEKLKKHNKRWIKHLQAHPLTGYQLPTYGTAGLVRKMQERNLLATRNYSRGTFDEYEKLSGETLADEYLVTNKGCVTCPIQCGRQVKAFGKTVKGPELETIGLLGSNLENSDMQNIINLNYLADDYGMDTMTLGSSIALAMELNADKIWKNELEFGKNDNLEDLVRKVAFREGIGDDIAEGTKRLSEKYGGKDYAIHSKGMELAAYEPRAAQGMGLGYAVSNRGGCHLNGGYAVVLEGLGLDINRSTTKGKAEYTVFLQDFMEAVSSAGSCLFTTYASIPGFLIKHEKNYVVRKINSIIPYCGGIVGLLSTHKRLMFIHLMPMMPHPLSLQIITGKKMNIGTFLAMGARGYDLERAINVKQGISAKDDVLPKRITHELQRQNDPDSLVRLDMMKSRYYKIRRWKEKGLL